MPLLRWELSTIVRDYAEEPTSLLPRILVGEHRHTGSLGGLLVESQMTIDLIGNT